MGPRGKSQRVVSNYCGTVTGMDESARKLVTPGCFGASFHLRPMKTGISRRVFLTAAVAGLGRAQDATFSTDVKVVTVLATVRDKKIKIVADLSKADFDLADEGRPQTIRYFARETDLPLTLGLLVDTSLRMRHVLGDERSASRRFPGISVPECACRPVTRAALAEIARALVRLPVHQNPGAVRFLP